MRISPVSQVPEQHQSWCDALCGLRYCERNAVLNVLAFVGGRPTDAFVGAQPESKVQAFIERLTRGG